VNISLDFLASNDFEYCVYAFQYLDFLTQIELFSDKCGKREMVKLEDDFKKDIALWDKHRKVKANLKKYIKDD
jgi:hypothetical protein